MKIAIGSTRDPKIEAVKEAWKLFAPRLLPDPEESVEFASYDVSQAIKMPLSTKELMAGACGRVESLMLQLKREKAEADFYVGMEAGFNIIDSQSVRRQVFLESWVYVSDGHQGYFGHSGGISVPARIAGPVIDRGTELGIVIDRFTQENNVRSKQGTWGILTRDLLTRRHSFVMALTAAFAPFYNPEAYK
ncbi:MAG: DUF84 family protein [Acidobacteriota bacterium]